MVFLHQPPNRRIRSHHSLHILTPPEKVEGQHFLENEDYASRSNRLLLTRPIDHQSCPRLTMGWHYRPLVITKDNWSPRHICRTVGRFCSSRVLNARNGHGTASCGVESFRWCIVLVHFRHVRWHDECYLLPR